MNRLPTFYISHGGGPCFWMDWGPVNPFEGLAKFLRGLAGTLPETPRAILVISGHWEEKQFTVQTAERPPMLYDYYGFPKHTYELQYPAPGSPAVAQRVQELLTAAGQPVGVDAQRGFDHGVFVPFLLIYPQAQVPVVQLSLKHSLDPREHLELGKILAPLRNEGVLIVGSGASYHNLRRMHETGDASQCFDAWLTKAALDPKIREAELAQWANAPEARTAHPREDHLIPLMVAAGAANGEKAEKIYSEDLPLWKHRTSAFRFG